jgi:arabinogalactan endo-1,4-beta-galactosidase
VSFDDIGLSYCDYWEGRLDVPQTDLDGLAAKFGKPVQAVPNGLGLGAFHWEPTWTVVKGNGWDHQPVLRRRLGNQALRDYSDTALPGIPGRPL